MVPTERAREKGGRYGRFFRWVDDKLVPVIGPANVGPYDDSEREVTDEDVCPVCLGRMGEHTIDHSTSNAVLHCPVEAESVETDTSPLNELGMPTEAARRRAERHDARA